MNTPDDLPPLPAIFCANLKGMLKPMLLFAGCTALSLGLYFVGDDVDKTKSLICAGIFGLLTLLSVWVVMCKKPLFTIAANGIERRKLPTVAWGDIAELKLVDAGNRQATYQLVGVFLKNDEKYYAGLKPSLQWGQKMLAGRRGGAPVSLDARISGTKPEKLLAWLQYYLEKSRQFSL